MTNLQAGLIVAGGILALITALLIKKSVYVIHEEELGIVETLGKFKKVAKAGPLWMVPLVTKLVKRLDTRLQNVDFHVNARTIDSATATAYVSLEFMVDGNKAYQAHYDLAHPERRLVARVTEIVTALLYTMSLDEALVNGKTIGERLKDNLTAYAADHGYLITNFVVTHVEPEKSILNAMSEKAALKRRNEIADSEATAANQRHIAEATAHAKVSELEGVASAAQQTAVFDVIHAAAKKLAAEEGIEFVQALRYVIQQYNITATRDSVVEAGNSIVTVGSHSDLVHAVAAGTKAGNGTADAS